MRYVRRNIAQEHVTIAGGQTQEATVTITETQVKETINKLKNMKVTGKNINNELLK